MPMQFCKEDLSEFSLTPDGKCEICKCFTNKKNAKWGTVLGKGNVQNYYTMATGTYGKDAQYCVTLLQRTEDFLVTAFQNGFKKAEDCLLKLLEDRNELSTRKQANWAALSDRLQHDCKRLEQLDKGGGSAGEQIISVLLQLFNAILQKDLSS